MRIIGRVVAVAVVAGGLAACGADVDQPEFSPFDARDQAARDRYGTIGGGITLFSSRQGDEDANAAAGGGGVGVNAYLWRASLETINFIPLASADPFGGLILTDWYQSASSPDERLKLQVLIRDTALRADGVKVTVLRQTRGSRGEWLDAPSDPQTASAVEDKILTRARELRVASLS